MWKDKERDTTKGEGGETRTDRGAEMSRLDAASESLSQKWVCTWNYKSTGGKKNHCGNTSFFELKILNQYSTSFFSFPSHQEDLSGCLAKELEITHILKQQNWVWMMMKARVKKSLWLLNVLPGSLIDLSLITMNETSEFTSSLFIKPTLMGQN